MIAKLTGILDSVGAGSAVIDVGGVGYLVTASARTLGRLGPVGSPLTLFIETQVREDAIALFGFAEAAERQWFRILCTVQGVGVRVALAILTVLPADQLPLAIAAQDKAALTRADGVGPKLAVRILTELKDKAGDIALGVVSKSQAVSPWGGATSVVSGDAVSALINLGYGRAEAFGVVSRTVQQLGENAGIDDVIRHSLKELSA